MAERAQVAVIGSGPAGLTASRYLGEFDLHHILLSKDSVAGESKVCGGFIPKPALNEFNLQGFPGSHEIHGACLKFPGHEAQEVWFDNPVGVNATRIDLGQALVKKAKSPSGIFRLGATVTSVKCSDSGCIVKYMQDGNLSHIECDLVIDSSGVRPVSLRNDGIRSFLSDSEIGYAFQYQVRGQQERSSFSDLNSFYFGSDYSPRGYAWVYPRGSEAAVGTGGLLSIVRQRDRSFPEYLDRLLAEKTPSQTHVSRYDITKREGALIPLAGIVKPSYGRRLILAGDAAAHCSPISGEGIHYAMKAGRLAAIVAKDCRKQRDFSEKKLRQYQREWLNEFGSDLKWGRRIQRRFMGSSSGDSVSSFLESDTALRTVGEMLLGLRSVRSAVVRCLPAYVKSKIVFWR